MAVSKRYRFISVALCPALYEWSVIRPEQSTGLGNRRLTPADYQPVIGSRVTFRWKDYPHGGKKRKMTLAALRTLLESTHQRATVPLSLFRGVTRSIPPVKRPSHFHLRPRRRVRDICLRRGERAR